MFDDEHMLGVLRPGPHGAHGARVLAHGLCPWVPGADGVPATAGVPRARRPMIMLCCCRVVMPTGGLMLIFVGFYALHKKCRKITDRSPFPRYRKNIGKNNGKYWNIQEKYWKNTGKYWKNTGKYRKNTGKIMENTGKILENTGKILE